MQWKNRYNFFVLIFLFSIYLINGIIAIPENSVVYDELDHWSYSERILKFQPEKIYPFDDASAMPVTALNAIPRAIEQLINPGLHKTDGGLSDVFHGRFVTLFICLLTGFFIYRWSKELFGESGGLFSLFLFVFCPNLNAHGILLTTDAFTALLTISTTYYFWKFTQQSGWKFFLLFSINLGIAQITKYTLLHLIFLFAVISLAILIKRKTLFSNWKKNLLRFFVLLFIVISIINVSYFLNGTGKSISNYETYSNVFKGFKNSVLGKIPVPLPEPYIKGIDITMYMNELGAGDPKVSGDNYLFGEKKSGKGFWYYYLVVFFYKTPLPFLIILLLSFFFIIRNLKQTNTITFWLLIGIPFYFLIILGLFNNVQIGIRHAILIYPFIYVMVGFMVTLPISRNIKLVAVTLVVLYSAASFYFYYPNLISYSNEFIANKKNAYKIMADSNIDYGQGVYVLEKYLKKHPDVNLAGSEPGVGKFIISVNDYLDLNNSGKHHWLKKYKPVEHVNFCYLLFDIKSEIN
jgi:hypothetical protein